MTLIEDDIELKDEDVKDEELKDEEPNLTLPPIPCPLLHLPPEQEEKLEHLKYQGDMKDIPLRMKHKLWLMWNQFGAMRNDERLFHILDEEHDKDSDDFYIRHAIVQYMDVLGRVLGATDILEELRS